MAGFREPIQAASAGWAGRWDTLLNDALGGPGETKGSWSPLLPGPPDLPSSRNPTLGNVDRSRVVGGKNSRRFSWEAQPCCPGSREQVEPEPGHRVLDSPRVLSFWKCDMPPSEALGQCRCQGGWTWPQVRKAGAWRWLSVFVCFGGALFQPTLGGEALAWSWSSLAAQRLGRSRTHCASPWRGP